MADKHFLFFKWKRPFVVNSQILRSLEADIRDAIMKGTSDEEQLILLSFLVPGRLLHRLFTDNKQRRDAKKRLAAMMLDKQVSVVVREAISAAQA